MKDLASLFENQPKVLSPDMVAALIGIKRETVYDWNYRPEKYNIPAGMLIKFGKKLLVRTDFLETWFISRCSKGA
jgi:hypothetical protein